MCLLFSAVSCGDETPGEEDDDGPVLVIGAGNTFATTELTVASGTSITVINNDTTPHTVTSESAEDAFDNTGDFDVIVAAGGTDLLTVPEDAASGDVFFFYCRLHTSDMSPANGTITVE